jgi:hypothetical protein
MLELYSGSIAGELPNLLEAKRHEKLERKINNKVEKVSKTKQKSIRPQRSQKNKLHK